MVDPRLRGNERLFRLIIRRKLTGVSRDTMMGDKPCGIKRQSCSGLAKAVIVSTWERAGYRMFADEVSP